jgi:hypothetical protein
MVFAYGQVRGSYDYLREQRRTHKAEVRAAHAEGRAEAAAPWPTQSRSTATASPALKPKRRWF